MGGREGDECSVWIVCVGRGGGVRWGWVCQCVGVRLFLHNTVGSHLSEHVGIGGCSDN